MSDPTLQLRADFVSAREIIQAVYKAYGERDLEGTMGLVSDGFCWNAAIDPGDAPYGGSC